MDKVLNQNFNAAKLYVNHKLGDGLSDARTGEYLWLIARQLIPAGPKWILK
jgi:hypothetical protein